MLYFKLPIYKEVYALMLEVYEITEKFTREHKYTLGQEMKQNALQLVKLVYKANASFEKCKVLESFLELFEQLKMELRLALDLNLVSKQRLQHIKPLLVSIGKQLNGWKKQYNKQNIRNVPPINSAQCDAI